MLENYDQSWYQSISSRIRTAMKEKNVTPEELAEKTGIAPETIGHWLDGSCENCGIADLEKIAKVLSVDPGSLL